MAEKIISPGVFTRENDLSFLQQGIADSGAAFVGPFKEGPLVPTIVTSQSEFEQLFGKVDSTYYTPIAVQAYLKESNIATICRVAGVSGYTEDGPVLLTMTSATGVSSSAGILFSTDSNTIGTIGITTFTLGNFAISGSSRQTTAISASLNPSAVNDIEAVFGSNPRGSKDIYSYAFFRYNASSSLASSTWSVTGSNIGAQDFATGSKEARTPYIQSQAIAGERYNLFRFETIGAGTLTNTKVKVAITNVKAAEADSGTNYGTFTVVIRAFDDTNKRKTVYETYSNVTLDPSSVNYIYRVIGDRYVTINNDGKVTEYGDWPVKSKYVRMVAWQRDSSIKSEKIPAKALPFGHDAYKLMVTDTAGTNGDAMLAIPKVTFVSASSDTYGGIDLDVNTDNKLYMKPIPASATTGSNTIYSLENFGISSTSTTQTEIAKRNFVVAFQEGWDGMNPTTQIKKGASIEASNVQGFDCSTITADGSVAYLKQINALSNADEYDINLVVTPGLNYNNHMALVDKVIDMVTNRSDAFYVLEGMGYTSTVNEVIAKSALIDSNYAGMYYPWIKTADVNTKQLISVPPSTLIPAMYSANDKAAAEWFAPAGLNRGGIDAAVTVIEKLTQTDRDNLYEGKVNPIVRFPAEGVVAFGQKTLQRRPSALDRINVRRLLLTIKKYIASTSRYLIFEQNTSTTRNRFLNIVNPYLEGIQQRQGLYAFKVVMDESNNTPDSIDRNFLNGSIYLQPAKTAEFIQIDFNILPTGATFGG
jgi:hypothetical protein